MADSYVPSSLPNFNCYGHLGSELIEGRSLSLSLMTIFRKFIDSLVHMRMSVVFIPKVQCEDMKA